MNHADHMEVAIMKNLLPSWVECLIQERSKLDSLTSNVLTEKSRSLYEDNWNITSEPSETSQTASQEPRGENTEKMLF